jgi:hypothetical protein
MATDLFQFFGRRSKAGYVLRPPSESDGAPRFRIQTERGAAFKDDLVLAPVSTDSVTFSPRADLFLRFAQLDPESDEAILSFANTFGLLGPSVHGEPLSHWRERIRPFRKAVWLWQQIQSKDIQQLTKAIIEQRVPLESFSFLGRPGDPDKPEPIVVAGSIRRELLEEMRRADALGRARLYLQAVVNERLAEHVAPRLLWVPEEGHMGLFIVPVPDYSLHGFLWLQLAQSISGSCAFRPCAAPGCGKLMLVAGDGSGSRTHKTTCSNACRVRLSARKRSVRQLHREGKTTRQIATKLSASVEQVQGWLKPIDESWNKNTDRTSHTPQRSKKRNLRGKRS